MGVKGLKWHILYDYYEVAYKEKFAQISGQDKTECGLSLTQRRMAKFGKIERQQAFLAWKIL